MYSEKPNLTWCLLQRKKYSDLTWFCCLCLTYPHKQEKPVWWQSCTWSCFHQVFFSLVAWALR